MVSDAPVIETTTLRSAAASACRAAGLPTPAACTSVRMPPTWRGPEWIPYTFVFAEARPSAAAVHAFYTAAARSGIPNPRLFWPDTVALASLFHPLFFAAAGNGTLDPAIWVGARSGRTLAGSSGVATVRFWLQSTMFLAGVTLSAAIVQSRWSAGTIASKLDRLWQAAQYVPALRLTDVVRACARGPCDVELLIELKRVFARALASLADGLDYPGVTLAAEPPDDASRRRFGFVEKLRRDLGDNLRCVIAYGSSVTSPVFADYDLILVVDDAPASLRRLAASHPSYRDVELNLSVFDETEFRVFQSISGDNLTDHTRCLHGEVVVPVKPADDLLLRNYSFGFVRLRQLIGMAAHAVGRPLGDGSDEKRSLYGYFAKIPLNVMKGIRAALGEPVAKDEIAAWMRSELDYDAELQLRDCIDGRADAAISTAAWATAEVMTRMNGEHPVYRHVHARDAQLWQQLERVAPASNSGAPSP
jgi:hypothetical protein